MRRCSLKTFWREAQILLSKSYQADMIYLHGFYKGDLVRGKPNGKGKFFYADGDVFEGTYVDGKREGHGKMSYDNGITYEGNWVNGKQRGPGKFYFGNNYVYIGDMNDGLPDGFGKMTELDGAHTKELVRW